MLELSNYLQLIKIGIDLQKIIKSRGLDSAWLEWRRETLKLIKLQLRPKTFLSRCAVLILLKYTSVQYHYPIAAIHWLNFAAKICLTAKVGPLDLDTHWLIL
jgi:hypothetical protein